MAVGRYAQLKKLIQYLTFFSLLTPSWKWMRWINMIVNHPELMPLNLFMGRNKIWNTVKSVYKNKGQYFDAWKKEKFTNQFKNASMNVAKKLLKDLTTLEHEPRPIHQILQSASAQTIFDDL